MARKAYCEKCPLEQWCMKTLEEKKGSRKKAVVGKMPAEKIVEYDKSSVEKGRKR